MRFAMVACLLWGALASEAVAQRGFVEGLFRTIAEAQLERNRANFERSNSPQPIPPRQIDVGRVTPSSQSRLGPIGTGENDFSRVEVQRIERLPFDARPRIDSQFGGSNSTEIWLTLVRMLESLNANLRREATVNANLRSVIPDTFRIAAQARSLAGLSQSGREDQISANYPSFDQAYRAISYTVRSSAGVSTETRQLVREGDRLAGQLSRLYGVEPQWNKQRFDDIVLTSQTHLRTLLDDLELISLSESNRRNLTHDLRLFIQQLIEVRQRTASMSYTNAAEAFANFTADTAPTFAALRRLRDPHIDRRLDRLAELADETYGLLWMTAPVTSDSLIDSASRLEIASVELQQSLSASVLRSVERRNRDRIEDLVRDIDRNAHDLIDRFRDDRSGRSGIDLVGRIDAASAELEGLVRYLPGNHHQPLALVRSEIATIGRATGTPSATVAGVASLLPAAATLEGSAEAIRDELRRIDRYLQPSSYRGEMRRASDDFYRASREVHEAIADRRDAETVVRRAKELIQPWQTLSSGIEILRRSGARDSQARLIEQYRDALLPAIGDIAAVLEL